MPKQSAKSKNTSPAGSKQEETIYRISGRVTDRATGSVLVNLRIELVDHDWQLVQRLGSGVTDAVGQYTISFSSAQIGRNEKGGPELQIRVFDQKDQLLGSSKIMNNAPQDVTMDLALDLPATLQVDSTSISQIVKLAKHGSSPEFLSFLDARGIRTLADVRKSGGLSLLEGLPVPADDALLVALEAHANLSVMPTDLNTNRILIDTGYTSFLSIAETLPAVFAESLGGMVSGDQANSIHAAAAAQARHLSNYVTGLRLYPQNAALQNPNGLPTQLPGNCGCSDCQNALSPMAYLADLLDYAVRHLRQDGNLFTLSSLQNRFHQPFRDLPNACDQLDLEVLQVRICIEVLRGTLPPNLANVTPPAYLETAYLMLLDQHGTSFDEIRSALKDKDDRRKRLADRLMIQLDPGSNRPDALDEFYRNPNPDPQNPSSDDLTEQYLMDFFGLRDTRIDPFAPDTIPALQPIRLQYLYQTWLEQDQSASPPLRGLPVIDPDNIDERNLRSYTPNQGRKSAQELLQARQNLCNTAKGDLNTYRTSNGLAALLAFLQTNVFFLGATGMEGLTVPELRNHLQKQQTGEDISAWLVQVQLRQKEFDFLTRLVELDAAGQSILDTEWSGFYDLIVQRFKRFVLYTGWRDEEFQEEIQLGPAQFQAGASPPADGENVFFVNWRADHNARQQWQDLLFARTEQEQTLIQSFQQINAKVEEQLLSVVRDELLRLAPPNLFLNGKIDWLTDYLEIDLQAGSCQRTTRIAQAIETILGILFGAKNGLLGDKTISLDAPFFEEEWQWIGSYSTWRAAMQTFLYPENVLRPTLRREPSEVFAGIIDDFRINGKIDQQMSQAATEKYSAYFRDICSLSFVTLCSWSGQTPFDRSAGSAPASAVTATMIITRGGFSGKLYYCLQNRRPDFGLQSGFKRSTWKEIAVLEPQSQVVSITPYRDARGQPLVGLYVRESRSGITQTWFTRFNGNTWSAAQQQVSPSLFTSYQSLNNTIPALAGSGWQRLSTDRLFCLDLDGDGRDEILVVSEQVNNQRSIGVLREVTGALFLSQRASIPAGWHMPNDQNVILRTTLVQSPDRRREQLLVIETVHGVTHLGLLGLFNGALGLSILNASGSINNPAGQPWVVNSHADFLSADIDGDGYDELIAVEYPAGTQTSVTTLNVRENQISFKSSQILQSWIIDQLSEEIWSRFLPFRGSRNQVFYSLIISTNTGGSYRVGVINWLTNTNLFTDVAEISQTALLLPGSPKPAGFDGPNTPSMAYLAWVFKEQDSFKTMEWDRGHIGQELFTVNTSHTNLGILVQNPVSAATEFGMLWHSEKLIEPAADYADLGWVRKTSDSMFPADLDGDGEAEIVAVDFISKKIGVLKRNSIGNLETVWTEGLLVSQPGGWKENGWVIASGVKFQVADLDGDGCDEILIESGNSHLAILHGHAPLNVTYPLGVTSSFGLINVSEKDVIMRGSELWSPNRIQNIQNSYLDNSIFPDDPDLIYLDEAYYFLPLEIGIRFRESGQFTTALDWFRSVYDYTLPAAARKIAYKLVLNGQIANNFGHTQNWLQDPLDPHALANTRTDAYTRFTLLAIIGCLLDFADDEFTQLTSESVPRARELYLQALQLLHSPEIMQDFNGCSAMIGTFVTEIGDPEWTPFMPAIMDMLEKINNLATLAKTLATARQILGSDSILTEKAGKITALVTQVVDELNLPKNMEEILTDRVRQKLLIMKNVLAEQPIADSLYLLGKGVSGGTLAGMDAKDVPAGFDPARADILKFTGYYIPAPAITFCIAANPVYEMARSHALLNLDKIRNCRNIAGMEAHLEIYAVPTVFQSTSQRLGIGDSLPSSSQGSFQPLPYRYATLVERARQLIDLARQLEASMLTFIENSDRARYDELRARQDLSLSQASVRLKDLQVKHQVESAVGAELQRNRAEMQRDHYEGLIAAGLSFNENIVLASYVAAAGLNQAAAFQAAYSADAAFNWGASSSSSTAAAFSNLGQVASANASYERREQEWQQQVQMGNQDIKIANEQIRIANSLIVQAQQELAISNLQVSNANDTLDFLVSRKFATSVLYEWMSRVLEGIYRFFLQQATAMAKLAENQLTFERQELSAVYIQKNYWNPPSQGMTPDFGQATGSAQAANVRGLTGSARLLRDLFELDQYAFRTNQRKLQMSETISLFQMDPFAFEKFRQTGVLPFSTSLEMFDRKFPGHYLRLVRTVRISIAALIPPQIGIHATLSTTGTSKVVIGKNSFQKVNIQRGPETVALTSPVNANGLFDLNLQSELLLPFEGIGVDTNWEFRMPKAANIFDYQTIADILFTVDYTALDSSDYRSQIIKALDRRISADRAFSFRNEFADQWYDLHNAELIDENNQMKVSFRTELSDFPANLESVSIQQVMLYFACQDGSKVTIENVNLVNTSDQTGFSSGGDAQPVNGKISTRSGAWNSLIGQQMGGEWAMSLRPADNDPNKLQKLNALDALFKSEKKGEMIEDILLVISYSGLVPPWPK